MDKELNEKLICQDGAAHEELLNKACLFGRRNWLVYAFLSCLLRQWNHQCQRFKRPPWVKLLPGVLSWIQAHTFHSTSLLCEQPHRSFCKVATYVMHAWKHRFRQYPTTPNWARANVKILEKKPNHIHVRKIKITEKTYGAVEYDAPTYDQVCLHVSFQKISHAKFTWKLQRTSWFASNLKWP